MNRKTTGVARQGDARLTTSRGNGSHTSQHPESGRNPLMVSDQSKPRLAVGDRVQPRPGTSDGAEGPGTVSGTAPTSWREGDYMVHVRHDGGTITSWDSSDLEPVHAHDFYECPVESCDFAVGAVGPVDPDEGDDFVDEVAEHQRSHEPGATPEASDTDPRTYGMWNTPAGDVIVFRPQGDTLRADVLADSRVEQAGHLRELAAALVAAADAWEAASVVDGGAR